MEKHESIPETPFLSTEEFADHLSHFFADALDLLTFIHDREYTSTEDLKQWLVESEFADEKMIEAFIDKDIIFEDEGWHIGEGGYILMNNILHMLENE